MRERSLDRCPSTALPHPVTEPPARPREAEAEHLAQNRNMEPRTITTDLHPDSDSKCVTSVSDISLTVQAANATAFTQIRRRVILRAMAAVTTADPR